MFPADIATYGMLQSEYAVQHCSREVVSLRTTTGGAESGGAPFCRTWAR
jgi:hypothetical protein